MLKSCLTTENNNGKKEMSSVCHLSRDARKPVFGVSDQVRHKADCAATEESKNLEILDIRTGGIVLPL